MVWRRARRLRWRASRAGDKETDTRLDGEVGWLGPIVAAANCCARIWSLKGRREQVALRCYLLSSILITVELRVLRNFACAQFRIFDGCAKAGGSRPGTFDCPHPDRRLHFRKADRNLLGQ